MQTFTNIVKLSVLYRALVSTAEICLQQTSINIHKHNNTYIYSVVFGINKIIM